jgi:hypothetical protein
MLALPIPNLVAACWGVNVNASNASAIAFYLLSPYSPLTPEKLSATM